MTAPSIKDIFEEARAIAAPSERAAFLDRACADHPTHRARIDALLRAADDVDDEFMAVPALAQASKGGVEEIFPANKVEAAESRLADAVSSTIGPYHLLKVLGEGGMGAVYLAEQTEPVRRKVALKLIRAGFDDGQMLARFEAERQALAMMDHEHIAKVFDGGKTPDGKPFFVMELVEGAPLTAYCDERRLPLVDRLALFAKVCHAVQHAHQKGIVHRDIKPSNVLVAQKDGVPCPKVIDFGVVKAMNEKLTDATLHTMQGALVGTLEYMSPEQAGLTITSVDTRSDVYSLGVLLYELLTGSTPLGRERLKAAALLEVLRAIREDEAPKPSNRIAQPDAGTGIASSRGTELNRLVRDIRGELDWIALRALEKDRARRYDSAGALARDIERFLAHEPIEAVPPSGWYRFRKLAQRHKAVVAGSVATLVALVAGLGAALWQAGEARRQRDTAIAAEKEQARLRGEADAASERARISEGVALRKSEDARRALAKTRIALADSALRDADAAVMQTSLAAVPDDLRDTNWHYLSRRLESSLPLKSPVLDRQIEGIAPHPLKPGVFVIVRRDGQVSLTNLATGENLLQFRAGFEIPAGRFYAIAISQNAERIAVSRREGQGTAIAIHNASTGEKLAACAGEAPTAIQFDASGQRLLEVCQKQRINLWNAQNGERLWTRASDKQSNACFHPSGRQIIFTERDRGLEYLNAQNGTVDRTVPAWKSVGASMAVDAAGTTLISVDNNGFLRCLDLEKGAVLYELRLPGRRVRNVAFTPDGRRFVTQSYPSGGMRQVRLWDARSGTLLREFLGAAEDGGAIAVHPLSNEIVTFNGLPFAWALDDAGESQRMIARAGIESAAFWDDDRLFNFTPMALVQLVDVSKKEPESSDAWISERSFPFFSSSRDRRAVAMATRPPQAMVQLFVRNGPNAIPTPEAPPFSMPDNLASMRLSPDGSRLWTRLGILDSRTGAPLVQLEAGDVGRVHTAEWVSGDRLASVATFGGPRGGTTSLDRLGLWDARSGKLLVSVDAPCTINGVAISSDDRILAEGGTDRMIRLRDPETLAVRLEFRAHDAPIQTMAFHPTLPVLATASEDLTIRLWDARTGRCLRELRGPSRGGVSLAFSPNGRRLACLSEDRFIHYWTLPESYPDATVRP